MWVEVSNEVGNRVEWCIEMGELIVDGMYYLWCGGVDVNYLWCGWDDCGVVGVDICNDLIFIFGKRTVLRVNHPNFFGKFNKTHSNTLFNKIPK